MFLSSGYTQISTIEHFILLDLLGAPEPSVKSYFIDTAWLFDSLVSAELRLRDSGALDFGGQDVKQSWRSFFTPRTQDLGFGYVLDDHIPFMKLGVSVLHIVASPFPRVWHSLDVSEK
jgi:glutaminyl-peptide cyclotransferase